MVEFILAHQEAFLAVDPGLGKTLATLNAFKFLLSDADATGMLVVAPLRVTTLTWPDEIEKWKGLSYANLRTPEGIEAWHRKSADVYLCNYEMLATRTVTRKGKVTTYPNIIAKCLKGKKDIAADIIVFDEITKMRSHQSKAAKEYLPHRHLFKRSIGLTGTPQPNSCLDLWGQIRVLDGGKRLGTSFTQFRNKYAEGDYMGYNWAILPGSEEMIQDRIKDMTLVLRSSDWMDIPPTEYEDIEVPLPPDMMKDYKRFQKDMLLQLGRKEVVALSASALVQKLAQYASGATYYLDGDQVRDVAFIHDEKIKALAKLHSSIHHRPLLVMTQFVHEAERVVEALPQATMFDDRKMGDWNAGKIPMWVAHPKSMSHGLQMQGTCCDIVFFTLGYSYEDYRQSICRIARTGQRKPTTVYRLLVPNTVDWAMASVLEQKEKGETALKDVLRYVKKLAAET